MEDEMKRHLRPALAALCLAVVLPAAFAQATGYGGRPREANPVPRDARHIWLWSEGGYQWVRYQNDAQTRWTFRVKPAQLERTLSVRVDTITAMAASLRPDQIARHGRQGFLSFEDLTTAQQKAFVNGPILQRATGGAFGSGGTQLRP
jgi:hypothetical protein